LSLYLKNGKVVLPASTTQIFSRVLYELKTNKVRDVQVIQHNFKNIEIQIKIDDNLRGEDPSVEEIFMLIKKGFQEKVGSDVKIDIKEVKNIDRKYGRIVSKIDLNKFNITGYV